MKGTTLLRPDVVLVLAVAASFLCWALPPLGHLRKGYQIAEPLTAFAVLGLVAWYGLAAVAAAEGYRRGRAMSGGRAVAEATPLESTGPLGVLTVATAIGVGVTYWKVVSTLGAWGMVAALATSRGNELRKALYLEYSAGLTSLRYLAALAGGLALYRLWTRRRLTLLDTANVVLLLLASLVSARILFAMAVFVAGALAMQGNIRLSRPVVRGLIVLLLVGFVVLSGFNYLRNANYYRQVGIPGIWTSGLSEIVAYIGSPFQVSVAAFNRIGRLIGDSAGLLYFRDFPLGNQLSRYTDIESTLTGGSAVTEMFLSTGLAAFPLLAILCFGMGAMCGWAARYQGSYLFLVVPIVLYGFFDLIRTNLFYRGIFQTVLLGAVALPCLWAIAGRAMATGRAWPRPRAAPLT